MERRGKGVKDKVGGKRERSARKRERSEWLLLLTPAARWHWAPKISGLWQFHLVKLYVPEDEGPIRLQVLDNLVPTSAILQPLLSRSYTQNGSLPHCFPPVLAQSAPSADNDLPTLCLPANPLSLNRSLLLSMARLPAREWKQKGLRNWVNLFPGSVRRTPEAKGAS